MRIWFVGVLSVFVLVGYTVAQDDMADLKARVAALEQKASEQTTMVTSSGATMAEIPEVGAPAGVGKFGNFDVAVDSTTVIQQTLGDSNVLPNGDRADATISLDIRMATQLADNGIAFMLLEAGTGDGLGNEVGTLAGLREEADPRNTVRLSELWYQHSWCNKMVEFTIGKIDLTQQFDWNAAAKTEKTQFLASALNDNMAVEFPGDTLAAVLKVQPVLDLFYISLGWGDGNADLDDVFNDSFGILELGLTPKIQDLQGHYRVYGWINATNHTELTSPRETNATGSGIGVSLDQEVYQGVALFGRYGYSTEEVYAANQAWSVGLAVNGDSWGRKADTVAVAYNRAVLGDDGRTSLKTLTFDPEDESLVELYYRWAINRSVELSPVVQWVINAGGNEKADDVWVLGLRAQLWF